VHAFTFLARFFNFILFSKIFFKITSPKNYLHHLTLLPLLVHMARQDNVAASCSGAASPPRWHSGITRPPPAAPHALAWQRDGAAPCWLVWQEVLQFNSSTLNYLNKIVFEFQVLQNLACVFYKIQIIHFSNIHEDKYYMI
jgi:hypothetical protein